jgi:hypothetical protein
MGEMFKKGEEKEEKRKIESEMEITRSNICLSWGNEDRDGT